jgi:photosystem II stability/assembly factor-like uncharacterized protein
MGQIESSGFWLVVTLLAILAPFELTHAHSPHHVITEIASASAGSSDRDVFVLIADQVFRGDRTGASWKNLVNGLNNQYVFTSVVVSPNYDSDHTVFVSTVGDGVYRSSDRGDTWQSINSGLDRVDISTLALSPVYASNENHHQLLAASASGGVWRLGVDDKWQMVLTEGVRITDISAGAAIDEQPDIFAGDSVGRIWRSTDNGRLWEIADEFPEHHFVTSVVADQGSVFVGTRVAGLYKSSDAGATFRQVTGLRSVRRRDCQGLDLEAPLADLHITSVTIFPRLSGSAGPRRIFVTTWYDGVFVSADDGLTWTQWDAGLSCDVQADDMQQAHFRHLAIDTTDDDSPVFWLGAFDGLFRGEGPSSSWQQMETLPLGLIKGMAVTAGSDDLAIALATYGGGFYLTPDRGMTWTIGNKGLQTTRLTGLVFSPDYARNGVIYGGASRRLLRSSDYGQSWRRIDLRITSFGRRVRNKLRSWNIPTGWLGSDNSAQVYPTSMVMSADDDDKVRFATRFHGVMGYEHSTGSVVSLWSETRKNMNTLEISPDFENDHTLFASIRGAGVMRSDDGGINWVGINDGLAFVDQWMDDPSGGNLRRDVFIEISPDFNSDALLFAGSAAGDGLFVSHDRGNTWSRLSSGFGDQLAPVLAIALSPDFASDQMMMVSIKGQGIFRSVDGGQAFVRIADALTNVNASIEHLSFSPDFSSDRTVVAASDEVLFISEDAGDSWAIISRPVRYEDMRDVVEFTGETERKRGESYSALTETLITGAGSRARLKFVGSGVRWLGSRHDNCGSASVYLDGEFIESVNCHSNTTESMQVLFQADDLTGGAHEIEIRIEPDVIADTVGVDAFDILQTTKQSL